MGKKFRNIRITHSANKENVFNVSGSARLCRRKRELSGGTHAKIVMSLLESCSEESLDKLDILFDRGSVSESLRAEQSLRSCGSRGPSSQLVGIGPSNCSKLGATRIAWVHCDEHSNPRLIGMVRPSNSKSTTDSSLMARWIVRICRVSTESTSTIRLNSSKKPRSDWARPEKIAQSS